MSAAEALDLVQLALWTVLVCAGPALAAAMAVGLAVAMLQALTQVQEATLTFVPKIAVVSLTLALGGSFVGGQFALFAQAVYARVETGF
jgi:flagellar biosynthetic protein FliQ